MSNNNNNNVRTILVHAQEVKKDKISFIAFSTEINDVWFKVKFTKSCNDVPKERGLYDVTFDFDYCSLERGRSYVGNDGTEKHGKDTIWVRKIENVRQYTEEELAEANRIRMNTIFGD